MERNCPLLRCSTDIFHTLAKYLTATETVALSLTCSSTFRILFPSAEPKLDDLSCEALLLLLEKDLSYRFFYCFRCRLLHNFSSSWSPSSRVGTYPELPCRRLTDTFGEPRIGFHHVRLVMNAYRWGRGRGLSLSQLELTIPPDDTDPWKIKTLAKIIGGELFLSVTHELALRGSAAEKQRLLELGGQHRICKHLRARLHIPSAGCADGENLQLEMTQVNIKSHSFELSLNTDWDRTMRCRTCPTDYTVAFKQYSSSASQGGFHTGVALFLYGRADVGGTKHQGEEGLEVVTIVTYHLLGSGRSPGDFGWHTFSDAKHSGGDFLDVRLRPSAPLAPIAAGDVRGKWDPSIRFGGTFTYEYDETSRTTIMEPYPKRAAPRRRLRGLIEY